jgi:hypothetical protein
MSTETRVYLATDLTIQTARVRLTPKKRASNKDCRRCLKRSRYFRALSPMASPSPDSSRHPATRVSSTTIQAADAEWPEPETPERRTSQRDQRRADRRFPIQMSWRQRLRGIPRVAVYLATGGYGPPPAFCHIHMTSSINSAAAVRTARYRGDSRPNPVEQAVAGATQATARPTRARRGVLAAYPPAPWPEYWRVRSGRTWRSAAKVQRYPLGGVPSGHPTLILGASLRAKQSAEDQSG